MASDAPLHMPWPCCGESGIPKASRGADKIAQEGDWCQITMAGLNLTSDDLPFKGVYSSRLGRDEDGVEP